VSATARVAPRPRPGGLITFERLRALSFLHSAVYLALLVTWLAPGAEGVKYWLGWGHGLLWIGMGILCLEAVRRHVIPLWLGVVVVVLGGLGPFFGTIGFVVCSRRRLR
jgi:hypothetical protein